MPPESPEPGPEGLDTGGEAATVVAGPTLPHDSTPGTPPVRPIARTPVRVKRTITRYAFEFFQDQIEQLKKFSLEEQLLGEKGSMSQMVREAVDAYISKRARTET